MSYTTAHLQNPVRLTGGENDFSATNLNSYHNIHDAVWRASIVPIPGTTKLNRLNENVRAAAIELSTEDLKKIADALSLIQVQGDRYPAHLAARVGK